MKNTKHYFLSYFEENPDRKVDFLFVRELLKEVNDNWQFSCNFDWFVEHFFTTEDADYLERKTVFDWIGDLQVMGSKMLSWKSQGVINFLEYMDESYDYLIERAND